MALIVVAGSGPVGHARATSDEARGGGGLLGPARGAVSGLTNFDSDALATAVVSSAWRSA